ncbi:exonuclease VII large subunit [Legionella beliardensis]|uniref:Exodeoxyribonuclease 7 large subunit n=1 Tax=Legionella beliardensis TaxID=91822 RepID=A0A378I1S0_9GAMM|nr:exodeoxyribonuclease VII large subunit [Legionella beliardensis]STX28625.1 exonuclease VII large subunit [Legionella beliardensis]
MSIFKQELTPITVTQLNQQVRTWLEHELANIAVLGELSNVTRPASGHLYFTLKDQGAQIRCVFFRSHQTLSSKLFKDGQQVIVQGKLSLYEARGDYQLIVQSLTEAGIGELYQQFEKLKKKLEQQGLFAAHLKKPLIRFPKTIGVITSQTGAAIRDILCTLARRFPLAEVLIYPCEVQGKRAAQQLISAIMQANTDNRAEVILIARGGGSIEDLWPFNDEQLAIAINQSTIPIISGVGHETDFTICDFVADLRAATPTAAAEAATPDKLELINLLSTLEKRMATAIHRFIQQHQLILTHKIASLSSPEQLIIQHWQTVDYLEKQLNQQITSMLHRHRHQINLHLATLMAKNPISELQHLKLKIQQLKQTLDNLMMQRIEQLKQHLIHHLATLHAVSPLATLDRGYAIATYNDKILFNTEHIHVGDLINLQLAQGRLSCTVSKKEEL